MEITAWAASRYVLMRIRPCRSVLAMAYALLIASNTGNEILGFSLLLGSAALFAGWGLIDRRWAFLALQFFYAASAVIGLIRWA